MNKIGFTDERSKRRSFFFDVCFINCLKKPLLIKIGSLRNKLPTRINKLIISCNIFERVFGSQLKHVFRDKLSQFLSAGL